MAQLAVGSQVRVAYDFDGEESNEELTVKEGDILTIRFTDVGEGWLQGGITFKSILHFSMSAKDIQGVSIFL